MPWKPKGWRRDGAAHSPHTGQSGGHTFRGVFLVVFPFQQGQSCSLARHLLYREVMKEENHKQAK